MKEEKIRKGQFFTKKNYWLNDKEQLITFIKENLDEDSIILDPFFGDGDLIKTVKEVIPCTMSKIAIGFDIDKSKTSNCVYYNDSLISLNNKNIKKYKKIFIVTNPPYLSKVSAKRKKITNISNYYSNVLNDLYKVALNNMINSGFPGIAIIPESFINSSFFVSIHKKIDSITTIIPNPFEDTHVPICVVTFNDKNGNGITDFYINEKFIYDFNKFLELKKQIKISKNTNIIFNSNKGQIGLKAIDSNSKKDIQFFAENDFKYSKTKIKKSSRLMTYLYISEDLLKQIDLDELVLKANEILINWRKETKDLTMTPFRGNIKSEKERRRRIDYKTARWIIEQALLENNLANKRMETQ